MSSRGAMGSVYSTTVWEDMGQGAFSTKFAVTLQLVSVAPKAIICMRLGGFKWAPLHTLAKYLHGVSTVETSVE